MRRRAGDRPEKTPAMQLYRVHPFLSGPIAAAARIAPSAKNRRWCPRTLCGTMTPEFADSHRKASNDGIGRCTFEGGVNMLGNLKLILGGALAVVIFGAGYSFGARKVAALEAQIQAIKSASDDAEAKRKKSQEDIDKMLKDKEAEYAKQAQQLKARADQKAKDLAAALAGA